MGGPGKEQKPSSINFDVSASRSVHDVSTGGAWQVAPE